MILGNLSLILEGGGMRGMFSAGVFDAFMEKELVFPHIAGVSAGACNILSYMSGQKGRTRRIIEDFVGDDRYCSVKNWLRTRSLFGFDFILNDIPRRLLPFDYEAFYDYPGRLEVGTTDCETGESIWYTQMDMGKNFTPVRASASLPFFAPVVHFDKRRLLDGALTDPIPVDRGQRAGYDKFVIVLTRNKGYRKHRAVPSALVKLWYPHYPLLQQILAERPANYNKQLEAAEALAEQGKAVIIRPRQPLEIDRLDLDKQKLLALYDHGYDCGLAACNEILKLNYK